MNALPHRAVVEQPQCQACPHPCDDGDGNVVYEKPIPFTDFPLSEITFYFTDDVILLPSEY